MELQIQYVTLLPTSKHACKRAKHAPNKTSTVASWVHLSLVSVPTAVAKYLIQVYKTVYRKLLMIEGREIPVNQQVAGGCHFSPKFG